MSKAAKVPAGDAEVVARQNTNIEGLAESIENLCLATSVKLSKRGDDDSQLARQVMKTARADLRTALRAFVAPHLRLIEGGHQGYEPSVPETDHVMCGACNRDRICADANCPHWHEAIRNTIKKSPPPPDNVA